MSQWYGLEHLSGGVMCDGCYCQCKVIRGESLWSCPHISGYDVIHSRTVDWIPIPTPTVENAVVVRQCEVDLSSEHLATVD